MLEKAESQEETAGILGKAEEKNREIEKRANRKYAQRHKAAGAAQDNVG